MQAKFKKALTIFLLILILGGPTFAEEIFVGWDGSRYHSPEQTYRIGLALSGGGARGFSQIGVLRAFEESGITVAAISGTSIGGIVGGLYASGYSADSLEKIIRKIDFSEFFSNRPGRTSMFLTQRPEKERYLISIRFDGFKPYIPHALTAGQKLTDLLTSLTARANYISGGDFNSLSIPFTAVTTDIVSGEKFLFREGNLATAMRATMAFPLAFTGIERDSMILMDGGIVDPIPVDAIPKVDGNFDLRVTVNTTSDLLPKDKINNPIDIANQVTSIMQTDDINAGMKAADIVILPPVHDYLAVDFDRADSLIAIGYRAGQKAARKIVSAVEKLRRRDTLYITSIKYPDLPNRDNLDWSPLIPGGIIKGGNLSEIAGDLLHKNKLINLKMTKRATGNVIAGYDCYDIEIEALPGPNLDNIEINFKGNRALPDSLLRRILANHGPVISAADFSEFRKEIELQYRDLGLDMAHIKSIDYDIRKKVLDIVIDEAEICHIEISGNKRTKDWLIASSFPLKAGESFNSRKASDGIANIYGTDLFDRVVMNVLPTDSGAAVEISVEEKKYLQLRLGWHWDDEYNSEQFAELLDDNLLGTGQELLIHVQYAECRGIYEASLKADRFFSTYLTYRIKGYYHLLDRHFYNGESTTVETVDEKRLGGEFILGQQIRRFGSVTGEFRIEKIKNEFDSSGAVENLQLRTLGLRSVVETINRIPFPTAGKKHMFLFEYAADILGGESRFTRIYSTIESYFVLTDRLNFHPRLAVGWTDSDNPVPLSERFYIGGMDSFYGYHTDEMHGDKMILGNLEFRYKLPYRFYALARFDLGDVYPSADHIKLQNLRSGIGIALSFDSPLGPITTAYGRSDSDHERFYFSAGLAF